VLPVTAFGIVTALLLTVIGGAQTFWTWTDDDGILYQALAVIALVLLVVPLVSLGGAAARLSARRRDDRLATLRLLGATPATVSALAVIESSVLALVGAVAGVAVYLAIVPLLGLIEFRGEPLGASGVLLPWWALVAVPFGIAALAARAPCSGCGRSSISPLGVRTRQEAPRMHWVRSSSGVVVVALAFGVMSVLRVARTAMVILGHARVGVRRPRSRCSTSSARG
jgi:predicted lysophospholipase L1 biosynthesis ABC-type transport system permease subunit